MRRCGRDARTTAGIWARDGTGDGPGAVGVDDRDGLMSRLVGVGETPTPRPGEVRRDGVALDIQ